MKPHFKIENILSTEEINTIKQYGESIPFDPIHKDDPWQKYVQKSGKAKSKSIPPVVSANRGFDGVPQFLKDIICPKIEANIGKFWITQMVISLSTEPWSEHVDNHTVDHSLDPAYTVIIPLEVKSDCHTIVWNVSADYNERIWDDKKLGKIKFEEGYAEHTYTDYEKDLLSHCGDRIYDWGKPYAYKWNIGDILFLRRYFLHSSCNFIRNSLQSTKTAIVLMTRFKEK